MAQDNRVVNGQGQLEHHRHRVRHKGDLTKDKIGALVQQRRQAKGHNQHWNLHVGVGGEQQHQQNDHHCDDHNHLHLCVQIGGSGVAHVTRDIDVVALQQVLYLLQPLQTNFVIGGALICNGKQGGSILVVVFGAVKLHRFHPRNGFRLLGQLLRLIESDVVHHDPAGTEGDKLRLHGRQALPGLGTVGQIAGQIVVDRHPSAGKHAENCHADVNEIKRFSFVHNEGRYALHWALLFGIVRRLSPQTLHSPSKIVAITSLLSFIKGNQRQVNRQNPLCV